MEYLYETHLHTCEVSRCGKASPKEQVEHYHSLGYAGLIVTEHFFNGNCLFSKQAYDKSVSWEETIDCFTQSYYHAKDEGEKYGMDIMFGYEYSLAGNDFLIYGITPEWLKAHPEQLEWDIKKYLRAVRSEGALVVHAHPFREAGYIEMIRLMPRDVDGVEVYNANRTDFENRMAMEYADNYGLKKSAGSDNHVGAQSCYAGIAADRRYSDPKELIQSAFDGTSRIWIKKNV